MNGSFFQNLKRSGLRNWRRVAFGVAVALTGCLVNAQPGDYTTITVLADRVADGAASDIKVVDDGAGGKFYVWTESYRRGEDVYPFGYNIYAQRVDSLGRRAWGSNGVQLGSAVGIRFMPSVVEDGAGGIFIAWADTRQTPSWEVKYDIYAQRLSRDGELLWSESGVAVCTAAQTQWYPKTVSDGAGGVLVFWQDDRRAAGTFVFDLYGQRLDASGQAQWGDNGNLITPVTNDSTNFQATTDGQGGAILVWRDTRNDITDLYTQRVTGAGDVLWQENGLPLNTAATIPMRAKICPDNAGGAFIAYDEIVPADNIYLQRISSTGAPLLSPAGIVLCNAPGIQSNVAISTDDRGGAIVAWEDRREAGTEGNSQIYVQRVTAANQVAWAPNGVPASPSGVNQLYVSVAPNGNGGALVSWFEQTFNNEMVAAQQLSESGMPVWQPDAVRIPSYVFYSGPIISKAGNGRAWVAWNVEQIYLARIRANGELSEPYSSATDWQLFE